MMLVLLLKRLTARVTLQTTDQILTPEYMFEFANNLNLVFQHTLQNSNLLRKTFHSWSPGFHTAATSRELARIMSLFQVEKTLL